ncbi:MAG TPA: condensation domain-containing protein, partial [Methylomirabilota bacterium]|nr:condensation domain-containing protein [Methylomirabilota bacterium]
MNPLLRRIAALAPEKRSVLVRQNPLSFAQRRLWFIDQLEPGSASYNLPTALRFVGPLDVGALRESLAASAARHAILRTLYPAVDGEPMQLVLPPQKPPLPEIDLRALPLDAARREAMALADDEAGRPFDLAAGPTWRATVVRVAPGEVAEALFLLNLHHILADGWSLDLLITEMTSVYAGLQAGRPAALPPL